MGGLRARQGDKETRRQGDRKQTRRQGDKKTRRKIILIHWNLL